MVNTTGKWLILDTTDITTTTTTNMDLASGESRDAEMYIALSQEELLGVVVFRMPTKAILT